MSEFKVGDRVKLTADGWSTTGATGMLGYIRLISEIDGSLQIELDKGGTYDSCVANPEVHYRWTWAYPRNVEVVTPDGPVRTETVTRKVIVPGIYGSMRIDLTSDKLVHIRMHMDDRGQSYSATELRATARVFLALAEALEVHE